MKKTLYILSFLSLLYIQTVFAANNVVILTINNYTENELIYKTTRMYAGMINGSVPTQIPPGNATHPSVTTISFTPTQPAPAYPNACNAGPTNECVLLQQLYSDIADQSSITIQYDNQSGQEIYSNCTTLGSPISHDICSITWSPTNPVVDIRKN